MSCFLRSALRVPLTVRAAPTFAIGSIRRIFASVVVALALFAAIRVLGTLKPPTLFAPPVLAKPTPTDPIGHINVVCVAINQGCTTITSDQLVSVPANHPLNIRGWMVLARNPPTLADGAVAVIDQRNAFDGTVGGSRPDVARAYNEALFVNSGFVIGLPGGLRPGRHRIDVLALNFQTRSKKFVDKPVQIFAR